MIQKNNLIKTSIRPVLLGAGIAFILISVFLVRAGEPHPEWPKLWMLRPLVVVPLAGAAGGFFYALMDPMRQQGGWKKILANMLSAAVYIVGLWMGVVVGLDGTWWD